jgi:hypothetical protein
MNPPTLVITTVTESHSDYLLDFLISLRTQGCYEGEILVIDYGLKEPYLSLCGDFDAKVITLKPTGHPGSSRFLDMIGILENQYREHIIVQFDVDIWFQESILHLFPMASRCKGCLFALEFVDVRNIPPSKLNYGKPVNEAKRPFYESIMLKFMQEFNGQINIGFMAGRHEVFLEKLLQARELYQADFSVDEFCSDQYIFNILYVRGTDTLEGQLFNCVLTDIRKVGGIFVLNRTGEFSGGATFHGKDKVTGVHCSAIILKEKKTPYRFYTNYRQIFRKELARVVHRKAARVDFLLS